MASWNPTRIRWVNNTLETSTGATLVETDQGPAYAKLFGNPEGPQALFCEFVGTRAAAWLGLPTFDVSAIDVEEDGLVEFANGNCSQAGPAFVARLQSGTTWGGSAEELESVENAEAFAGLIVLDTWLRNCDRYRPDGDHVRRNTRNVFLADGTRKGKARLVAMDHTHILSCGQTLTKAIGSIDRIRDERLFGHFPEFAEYVAAAAVDIYAARLRSFRRADAIAFLAGIPGPWRPNREVTDGIAEFLTGRAAFVGQNIRQMLGDQGYLGSQLELKGDEP